MYKFYMGDVLLPVTPSKLQMNIDGNNKTVNLINDGEVNLIKSPKLTSISFECSLPLIRTYKKEKFKSAKYYLGVFEDLMTSNKPFKFKVLRAYGTQQFFKTNIKVTLEKYSLVEDAEAGPNMTVSISLKQYQAYKTKKLVIKKVTTKTGEKSKAVIKKTGNEKSISKNYKVKKGDCLFMIAKKELNNSSKWKQIYNLNKDVIEKAAKKRGRKSSLNGHYIFEGTILKLK